MIIIFDTLNIKPVTNENGKVIVFQDMAQIPTELRNDQYSLIDFQL